MEVQINNQQTRLTLHPKRLRSLASQILKAQGCRAQSRLSYTFVTHQKIRAFNKKFLGKNCATDVLAFDHSDAATGKKPASAKNVLHADVMISTDAVCKNSRLFQTRLCDECALYMIHGVLHCCGYDDHRPADIKRMRKREQELLQALKNNIKGIIK